ncbi:MAG: hypothetical protein IJ561_03470 [Ruminococcus sp.]|nr:hypothetical protein [Ruminococcus sp.]
MGLLVTKDNGETGELDELVSVIDKLMEQGDGHLTIDIDDTQDGIKVKRFTATDCGKLGACAQPTEQQDDE